MAVADRLVLASKLCPENSGVLERQTWHLFENVYRIFTRKRLGHSQDASSIRQKINNEGRGSRIPLYLSDARFLKVVLRQMLLFGEVWLQRELVNSKYTWHTNYSETLVLYGNQCTIQDKLTLKYKQKVVYEHRDSRQHGGVVYSQRNRSLFDLMKIFNSLKQNMFEQDQSFISSKVNHKYRTSSPEILLSPLLWQLQVDNRTTTFPNYDNLIQEL